jgi:hypothetical protein
MDLIAMRFEARHLEVEGKLHEALDICRDILRHYSHEPPNEQILPVFVQASEISIKLGDREGGATLLLLAADRYADAGLARPVIDLYQRLRRLGPARKGLDIQFARRMLAHRHPGAAREFLEDLARRQKKEKLQATLERMAAWSDDKVQQQLQDFLDRAEGIRVSTTQPVTAPSKTPHTPGPTAPPAPGPGVSAEVTAVRSPVRVLEHVPPPPAAPPPRRTLPAPPVPPPAPPAEVAEVRPAAHVPERPAPPEAQVPMAGIAPPADRVTGPRRGITPPPGSVLPAPPTPVTPTPPEPRRSASGAIMSADAVVFVTSPAPEPAPDRPAAQTATRPPLVPPPPKRRRRSRARSVALIAGAFVVVAAAAMILVPRIPRGPATGAEPLPPPAAEIAAAPAAASLAAGDSALALAAADSISPAPPRVSAPAAAGPAAPPPAPAQRDTQAAVRPPPTVAAPVTPAATQPRPSADTARPLAAAPPPVTQPAAAPPPTPSPAGADYPVVIVEGLEVLGIRREGEGTSLRVMVRQLLPSGDTLDLRESDLGEASVGVGVGRVLVSRHPSGGAMGTVRIGRYLVNARAPVAPEVLEPLLQKLVEKVPE